MNDRRERIPTKKELRRLLAEEPEAVYFDGTSVHDKTDGYWGDQIPDGLTITVCGPHPYAKRSWFASVKNEDGKLTVS